MTPHSWRRPRRSTCRSSRPIELSRAHTGCPPSSWRRETPCVDPGLYARSSGAHPREVLRTSRGPRQPERSARPQGQYSIRTRRAGCSERRQAAAEPDSARREPLPARGARERERYREPGGAGPDCLPVAQSHKRPIAPARGCCLVAQSHKRRAGAAAGEGHVTRAPRARSPRKCCALPGGPDKQSAVPGRRALQGLGGAENLDAEAVPDGTSCLVFFEVLRGAENLMGPQSVACRTRSPRVALPRAASGGGGAGLSTPESATHFLGAPRACPAGAAAGEGRA